MVRRASGEIRFCARRLHGNLPTAISKASKALGPDHPDVAISLNNLGALYNDQASTARPSCSSKRSLAIREKALGLDHPTTILGACQFRSKPQFYVVPMP